VLSLLSSARQKKTGCDQPTRDGHIHLFESFARWYRANFGRPGRSMELAKVSDRHSVHRVRLAGVSRPQGRARAEISRLSSAVRTFIVRSTQCNLQGGLTARTLLERQTAGITKRKTRHVSSARRVHPDRSVRHCGLNILSGPCLQHGNFSSLEKFRFTDRRTCNFRAELCQHFQITPLWRSGELF